MTSLYDDTAVVRHIESFIVRALLILNLFLQLNDEVWLEENPSTCVEKMSVFSFTVPKFYRHLHHSGFYFTSHEHNLCDEKLNYEQKAAN